MAGASCQHRTLANTVQREGGKAARGTGRRRWPDIAGRISEIAWLTHETGIIFAGSNADKAGVLSFVLKGFATEEVGGALNREGIAVRAGHHCAQPVLRRFGYQTTVRPSLALYNTYADIDTLVTGVNRLQDGRHIY